MSKSAILGTDERLKKTAGSTSRGSRETADASRTETDGTILSAEERRMLLRKEWVQEVLPTPPELPGFHCCWLSTTSSVDPVYKRIQRGYAPVTAKEVPGFGAQFTVKGGEFDGCISCNEMLLFKIPLEVYNDLMMIYHHEMPAEQEESIMERIKAMQQTDSSGKPLASVEGSFEQMGRPKVRPPSFI